MHVKVINEVVYYVGTFLMPALVNGDESGLSLSESKALERFYEGLSEIHSPYLILFPDDVDSCKDFGNCEVLGVYCEVVPITVAELEESEYQFDDDGEDGLVL